MSPGTLSGAVLSEAALVWLPVFVDAAIKGALLLALAWAATRPMRRSSAAARHLMWLVAVSGLGALPILSLLLPGWNVLPEWMTPSAGAGEQVASASEVQPDAPQQPAFPPVWVDLPQASTLRVPRPLPVEVANDSSAAPTLPVTQPTPEAAATPEAPPPIRTWQVYGFFVWLVGTVIALAPLALGTLSLWRLTRRTKRITGGPWASLLRQLGGRLGVRRRVHLLVSDRRSVPMHWGIVRPRILLPASAERWPADRVRLVLLHELGHVRRWDCLAQLVAHVISAVHWFNPLVWVALRKMQLEGEAACDDLALEAGCKPSDYAQHLLEIAAGLEAHAFAGYAAIAMARRSRLEGRLLRILDPRRNRRTLTRTTALLTLGLLVGLIVPMAMLRGADRPNARREQLTSEGEPAPAEIETDHRSYEFFLYVRQNRENEAAENHSLVLAKSTLDGFEQRDVYTKDNFGMSWTPLCVAGGKIYGIKLGHLIAVDVTTGKAQTVCRYVVSHIYDSGRLYATAGRNLRVFDFRKRAYRDICRVDLPGEGSGGITQWLKVSIAVSKDHRRLAFFVGLGEAQPGMAPCAFRLHVVDLEKGTMQALGPVVYSAFFPGGYGMICDPPPMVWLDAKTILLVHDVPKHVPKDPARTFFLEVDETRVATLDVATGGLTDLVTLPRRAGGLGEPHLRPPGNDGVPRIVIRGLGQYRIDVQAKRLIEDDRTGGDYRWSRGPKPERLLFSTMLLAEEDTIPEISVSPDGRRVLWLTGRFGGSQVCYFDSRDQTVRVVANGWFASNWDSPRRPEETIFLWADARDLQPADPTEPPAGWKRFPTRPWLEPRPREAAASATEAAISAGDVPERAATDERNVRRAKAAAAVAQAEYQLANEANRRVLESVPAAEMGQKVRRLSKLREDGFRAWATLFEDQREKNPWPAELGQDFLTLINSIDEDDEIPARYRERYLNFVEAYPDDLFNVVDLRRTDESTGETAGIVEWDVSDRRRIQDQLDWDSIPTTRQVRLTQEDLWVYKALLSAIAAANKGAASRRDASVMAIRTLRIGRDALVGKPAGVERAGQATPKEERYGGPLDGRYADADGKPLAADAEPPFAEFKMLPLRAVLVADQRKIAGLLVAFANASLPVEVRRVRLFKAAAGEEDLPEEYGPYTASLEIEGVVYIINPPDRTRPGSGSTEKGS